MDLVLGLLQRRFAPEVPTGDYGPRLASVVDIVIESLRVHAKWSDAWRDGDNVALSGGTQSMAKNYELVNDARLRLEQARPERRLRQLHKNATVWVRAHLKTQELVGQTLIAARAGDTQAGSVLSKFNTYLELFTRESEHLVLELDSLKEEKPSLFRLLGFSEDYVDNLEHELEALLSDS